MGLDIRWPIGLMFTLIGALMIGYGVLRATASTVLVAGDNININLVWGFFLLLFGALMLIMAIRAKKKE